MKSSFLLTSLLCAGVSFAQTAPSSAPAASSASGKPTGPNAVAQAEPNRVVAVINGKQITAQEAENLLNAIPPDQLKRYESNLSAVVQQIYMSKQLANQAVQMKLDQESPLKEQLELSRNQMLAQAYVNKLANSATSGKTEDPAQYYNAHPEEFDQVKISGIFVGFNPPGTPATAASSGRTEEAARSKADDIEKKLKSGGDFATLARTDSDNQQSAARGGEIGTFPMGGPQMPADLKAAIEKLQPGQVSAPIRIPNALLIVKLDSRKKLTLDEARPEITTKLQSEHKQAAVKQELDKYKIQVQDPDFFNLGGTTNAHIPSLQKPGSPALPTGVPAPPKK